MLTTDAELCSRLLSLHNGIRFVGVAGRDGRLVAHIYRKGVVPLLTPQQTEISVLQSMIRTSTREPLEEKLGETVYAFTMYKKVKRATIPLRDPGGHILLVSFDIDVDHEEIILKKILPELER